MLFAALLLMVPVWFACVRKLSRLLRERHEEKYEEMRLAEMWPTTIGGWIGRFDNSKAVGALFKFLLFREDRDLDDAEVSSLSGFMRWFSIAYIGLFAVLAYAIVSGPGAGRAHSAGAVAVAAVSEQREEALDLYRAGKMPQAIAAFDALLAKSGQDTELLYWRGMAQWRLGRNEQALQDFRRAIELEPSYFDAHRSADRILSQQRRWDETVEMWNRYLRVVPGDAEAHFERGGTHFHRKDFAAALADAARACELGKAEACPMAERLRRASP